VNEPRLVAYLDDTEPLTLAQARLQCRIDAEGSPPSHPDDDLLAAFVAVAREQVERFTGRALRYQRLRVALDEFEDVIDLPYSPVLAIESVSYVDTSGATVSVDAADYRLDVRTVPARLAPAVGTTWPDVADTTGAIEIVYTAGYPTGGSPDAHALVRAPLRRRGDPALRDPDGVRRAHDAVAHPARDRLTTPWRARRPRDSSTSACGSTRGWRRARPTPAKSRSHGRRSSRSGRASSR
jgi:uncharacterized phiE125 gp8 family phage protein